MKAIIRTRDYWVLCRCTVCGRLNYVEPHGTTAECKCSAKWTEHESIPHDERIRTIRGDLYVGSANRKGGGK